MKWTDQQVERLKQLTALNWSARQIALDIGCSRNAVCGKWDRLGMSVPMKPAAPRRPKVLRVFRPRPGHKGRATAAEAIENITHDVPPLNIPFVDRESDQCPYPTQGHGYQMLVCGLPTHGNWCPAHSQVVFTTSAGPRPHVIYWRSKQHASRAVLAVLADKEEHAA